MTVETCSGEQINIRNPSEAWLDQYDLCGEAGVRRDGSIYLSDGKVLKPNGAIVAE